MEEEIDLRELFEVFWEKKIFIIILAIVGVVLGAVYTNFFIVPKYSSSVTLVLTKATSEDKLVEEAITQSDISLNQKLIATYSEIIKSKAIVNKVIDDLKIDVKYEELIKGINVKSVSNTDVMQVTVTTKDPMVSASVADYITEVFGEEVDRIYNIKNIFIIDKAEVDYKPVNISLVKNVAIFGMVAIIIAMMIVFLIYFFDASVKSKQDVEKLLNIPVLGVIPSISETEGKSSEKR